MVIKVYTSGISGNKEVKKRQQRIMMILESKGIEYEAIDITEPGNEDDKQFMQDHAKPKDGAKHPLPPQIFNELEYCGDYDGFDVANENDELEVFLKMPIPPKPIVPVVNGSAPEPEHSTEKDSNSQVPERSVDIATHHHLPKDLPKQWRGR
uniref:SH3 domain-binding glutamic acid-rich n=1 Tax=Lygus hesperus TaxID=30085 RepID=A0A0A9VX63_LYGHE